MGILIVLLLAFSFLALAIPFVHADNPALTIHPDQNSPNSPHGTTNPIAGTYTNYTINSHFIVYETPNPGYVFDYWNEDGLIIYSVFGETYISLIVWGPVDLTPAFSVSTGNPTLIIGSVPDYAGITNPVAGQYMNYTAGSTVTITATAKPGYVLNNWYVNWSLIPEPNPFSFQITGETSIYPNYIIGNGTLVFSHTFIPTPLSENLQIQATSEQEWVDILAQNSEYNYFGRLTGSQSAASGVFWVTMTIPTTDSDLSSLNASGAPYLTNGAINIVDGTFSFTIPSVQGTTNLYSIMEIYITLTTPQSPVFTDIFLITWTYAPGTIGSMEYLFLTMFLVLGLGMVGFGMSKGKEPLAAIFMMEFGIFIAYLLGWAPAWVLAASIGVLAVILAYRFRGALLHN
jgi:hypothetical protein